MNCIGILCLFIFIKFIVVFLYLLIFINLFHQSGEFKEKNIYLYIIIYFLILHMLLYLFCLY